MPKTLVTGATGFIGSALVLELCRRNQAVRALVHSRDARSNPLPPDVEPVVGDLQDVGSLRRAVEGCDRVYHVAGLYANWLPNPDPFYRVNVEGTRNLLQVCRDNNVSRVVYTSSVAALGAHGKTPADESAVFNLASTRDHYYLSKYRAEQVALEFAAQGLPVVVVNPTNPLGPRDGKPTPTGALVLSVLKHQLPGYVDGGINLVDVRDVAVSHIAAMERGKPGNRYVLGNINLSIKQYFDLIAECGNTSAPSLKIPLPLATTTAYAYEALARLTGKPPITSVSWVKVGSQYSFWDSSKAITELGLPQTPIRESLRQAITWYRERSYL